MAERNIIQFKGFWWPIRIVRALFGVPRDTTAYVGRAPGSKKLTLLLGFPKNQSACVFWAMDLTVEQAKSIIDQLQTEINLMEIAGIK